MKNLDALQQKKAEIMVKLHKAMTDNDETAFAAAFEEYTDILQEAVMAEAKGLISSTDNQVLAGRGVRVLTSQERGYYEKLIEAMRSDNPKQALSSFDVVLPETIIDAVFEDLTETHPLLSEIKFENAGALVKYLYSTMDGRFVAHWGPLCSKITKELGAQFNQLPLEQTKLSAFVPVCKAMLDLGPAWLDRFVRTILSEATANGLEKGIIQGRGVATMAVQAANRIYEPIGMDRDLTDYDNETGYAQKKPTIVTQFTPEVYGNLISQLATSRNGLCRQVTSVILIVNPIDYFKRVMPATIYRRPDGSYVNDILPFPTKIIQSVWVTEGTAIIGLPKKYFMAMGTGKDGRIEYSDEYKFLEDERTYLIKFYGNGTPIDNTSFLLLDISNLEKVAFDINVVNQPVEVTCNVPVIPEAKLRTITVGGVEVEDFSPSKYEYAAEVKGEGDTANIALKVAALDEELDPATDMSYTLDGVDKTFGAGGTATIAAADGKSYTIVITVTNSDEVKVYVLLLSYDKEAA